MTILRTIVFPWAALLPLLVLTWTMLRYQPDPPRIYKAVAFALAVSWIADMVMKFSSGNDWWVSFVYPPVQVGIILWALIPDRLSRGLVFAGLGLVALTAVARGPLDRPETVVEVGLGLVVAFLVAFRPDLGRLRGALLVLFGLGGLALLFREMQTEFGIGWIRAHYGYQGVRMTGLAWAAWAMLEWPRYRSLRDVNA